MAVELRKPALKLLPEFAAALERGWSPDNTPSQAVVLKNGGRLHARENGGAAHHGAEIIRWRIAL